MMQDWSWEDVHNRWMLSPAEIRQDVALREPSARSTSKHHRQSRLSVAETQETEAAHHGQGEGNKANEQAPENGVALSDPLPDGSDGFKQQQLPPQEVLGAGLKQHGEQHEQRDAAAEDLQQVQRLVRHRQQQQQLKQQRGIGTQFESKGQSTHPTASTAAAGANIAAVRAAVVSGAAVPDFALPSEHDVRPREGEASRRGESTGQGHAIGGGSAAVVDDLSTDAGKPAAERASAAAAGQQAVQVQRPGAASGSSEPGTAATAAAAGWRVSAQAQNMRATSASTGRPLEPRRYSSVNSLWGLRPSTATRGGTTGAMAAGGVPARPTTAQPVMRCGPYAAGTSAGLSHSYNGPISHVVATAGVSNGSLGRSPTAATPRQSAQRSSAHHAGSQAMTIGPTQPGVTTSSRAHSARPSMGAARQVWNVNSCYSQPGQMVVAVHTDSVIRPNSRGAGEPMLAVAVAAAPRLSSARLSRPAAVSTSVAAASKCFQPQQQRQQAASTQLMQDAMAARSAEGQRPSKAVATLQAAVVHAAALQDMRHTAATTDVSAAAFGLSVMSIVSNY